MKQIDKDNQKRAKQKGLQPDEGEWEFFV